MAPAYRYHRLFLQYLQSAHPGAALGDQVTCPSVGPRALMGEYPEALIVHTHRDPLRVVCSLASLSRPAASVGQ